jgi:hypothetical protein
MLNTLTERPLRQKVEGIIRLGTKDVAAGGRIRNEPYFILKDAPEVVTAYNNDTPEAIHIVFPSNDLSEVADTSLSYWKGVYDKSGKLVPATKPACRSERGPGMDGTPGEAIWYDRNSLPPKEDMLSDRDPVNGYIKRVCRGEECCHWEDDKGRPMCKASMVLKFFVPMTGYFDLYRCVTHSKNSMGEIYSYLSSFVISQPGGLLGKVFRLYKEGSVVSRWDDKKKAEVKTVMPILKIKQDREFVAKFGDEMTARFKRNNEVMPVFISSGTPTDTVFLPPPDDGSEDGVVFVDDEPAQAEMAPAQRADLVLQDPEVWEAFDKLEAVMGKTFPSVEARTKARHVYILQKEAAGGNVKDNVIDGLTKSFLHFVSKLQVEVEQEKAQESLTLGSTPDPIMSGAVPPPEEDVQATQEALENLDPLPSVEG